jgi:phage terminase small subunit
MKKPQKGERTLTPKQRRFVEAYLSNGRNAAAAYRAAYATKAKPAQVAVEATRLLRHPRIALIVAEADAKAQRATEKVVDRYAATQERIVAELARIGFASMADYVRVQPDGTAVVDLRDVDDDQFRAVSEVTVEQAGDIGDDDQPVPVKRVKIKLHDKRAALVDLARIQGFVVDRKEISGVGGKPIEVEQQVTAFGRELLQRRFKEIARRRQRQEAQPGPRNEE